MSQLRVSPAVAGTVARPAEPDCKHGTGPILPWLTAIGEVRRELDGARLNCPAASFRDDRETGQSERYPLPQMTAIRLNPSLQEPKQ